MPHRIIGIICTSPGWGGLELNTLRLARWLGEAGWKVHLIAAGNTPIHQHAGDAPSSVSVFSDQGLPGKGAQLRALNAWVRRFKIHVLFVPYNKDIAVASLYKRFYDGDIGLVYQQHMQVGVRKRDLIHTLRYAMIDVWISPLQYLKEETMRLTRVPEEKIEVIPFGIEPAAFLDSAWTREGAREALSLPYDAYIIGVLGRLDPKKGQDLVVRALQRLRKEGNAACQVLFMGSATINEGDVFSRGLHQQVQDAGLQDYVHFRSYTEDVMVFFRAIDVFAMPSHGETFGMVTLEAMAAGVPVIGTDRDGTREILGEGRYGWLFKKDDVEDFCLQFEHLRSGRNGSDRVLAGKEAALNSYSKSNMVEGINKVLLELIEEN